MIYRRIALLLAVLAVAQWPGFPGFWHGGGMAYAQVPGLDDPGSRLGAGSATGGLVAVQEKIEAGSVQLGSASQVVVRFRNEGGQPVKTGMIRLYPSSNVSASIALNQCEEEPLAPGAECAVAITVKGLQSGSWRVEMLMSHSGRTRLVTSTLAGIVESNDSASNKSTSDLETVPSELNFDTLTESQTLTKPVTLRNITSNPISIKELYIDSSEVSGYSMKSDCKELGPGQACIAVISWSPKLSGRSSGVLVVKHNGPTALTSVPMTGTYTPGAVEQAEIFPKAVPGRGLLVASQKEVLFGEGVQTASTITISLVNAGDAPVTLKDIRISGSDNGLGFKEGGCAKGTVLNPIEACPLTVAWSPTRIGAVTDDIQILHDGARGVLVLPVRGAATAAVSEDQKAIVLTDGKGASGLPTVPMTPDEIEAALSGNGASGQPRVLNPTRLLDGYRITSFGRDRAIINGPGGSRLVFDQEETSLGGVSWYVSIKDNGIEFLHEGQRVLLLFDKSLSSINRVPASSSGGGSAAPATPAPAATPPAAP